MQPPYNVGCFGKHQHSAAIVGLLSRYVKTQNSMHRVGDDAHTFGPYVAPYSIASISIGPYRPHSFSSFMRLALPGSSIVITGMSSIVPA